MKKSILFVATAVLVFAACQEVDTFKKDIQTIDNEGEAIGFTPFTQKLTRAENNSTANYSWEFYNHHNDFKVFAFKNPNTSHNTPIFVTTNNVPGVVIKVTEDNNAYKYDYDVASEARYWDKAATTKYHFYAAAPANGAWTLVTSEVTNYDNQDKAYFTTTSTLSGVNLRAATTDNSKTTSLSNVESTFKSTADVDKLIAEECKGNYNSFVDPNNSSEHVVQLHFTHILSKINVTVKKDATALGSKTVKLLQIKFFNLNNTGDFTEGTTTLNAGGTIARWNNQDRVQVSSQDVVYSFVSADGDDEDNLPDGVTLNATDANEKIYFIESLVIPQSTATQDVEYDGTITGAYYTYEEYNAINSTNFTEEEYANNTTINKSRNVKTDENAKPYFMIQYMIDDELFTSYHNLANSFKAQSTDTHFDFNEGYQNTLNINICPEKIDFTADVADWGTEQDSYTDVD